MATGSLDANGIWIYGEDDSEATFSALLNKLGDSTSDVVAILKQSGRVVNTVSTTMTSNFAASIAQGAFTAVTGLSVSITPKSTANKILVIASINCSTSVATIGANFRLKRGATAIGIGAAVGSRQQVTAVGAPPGNYADNVGISYLDSPSTTSATTYSVDVSHGYAGTTSAYVNYPQNNTDASWVALPISTITVMEIAG